VKNRDARFVEPVRQVDLPAAPIPNRVCLAPADTKKRCTPR
jgi:hypothetical protein